MKVSELAKEFKTTTEHVLDKLRSLKLRAKDGDQELSRAVIIVLKSELIKDMKETGRKKAAAKAEKKTSSETADRKSVTADAVEEDDLTVKSGKGKAKTAKAGKGKEGPVSKKGLKKSGEDKDAGELKKKTGGKKGSVKQEDHSEPEGTVVSEDVSVSGPQKAEEAPIAQTGLPDRKETKDTHSKKHDKQKAPDGKEQSAGGGKGSGPINLDFKIGETAFKSRRKGGEKGPREKRKAAIVQPFISLKPFNKKRKKTRADEAPAQQPGVAASDLPVAFSEDELKPLEIGVPIMVKDFANAIGQKAGVVLQMLMRMKIFANINQNLDSDVVEELAKKFGYQYVQIKTQEEQIIDVHKEEEDDISKLTSRAPVVTFMGHVDHGKTSLLDQIRRSKVADQEHGGITQHIGAYSVELEKGRITFLDTPGHAAFTAMRSRGAHITDMVVLVIAADEGIMPQTEEAIDHARAAGVPIVVALNKMDRSSADPDRVKKQLSERGLSSEDWGGETIVVPVSAATGEGIDSLLEMILLQAEMSELKANKDKSASGIIIEANLSQGRGAVITIIVQSGTLHLNDILVAGPYYGKIKAMFDDRGRRLEEAGPSTPVEILGLNGVPEAGSKFYALDDERLAREITEKRRLEMKDERFSMAKRITLEDIYSQIQEGVVKELNVILKADVQGSMEALRDSLAKIPSDEVKVKFIHMGVGDVNASDVILAAASNAIIIAFHVGIGPRAAQELEKQPVDIRQYRIIYDAVDDVKKSLSGLLAPKIKRTFLARVEVRQVFNLSKSGLVAGCIVLKGKVKRKDKAEVLRNGEIVFKGQVSSLKRFKDDVREVAEGYECGLTLDRFDALQEGDIVEVYHEESISRSI